ncbi:hypothetical protein ABPG75_003912 [Micractinium tetrahymenae]
MRGMLTGPCFVFKIRSAGRWVPENTHMAGHAQAAATGAREENSDGSSPTKAAGKLVGSSEDEMEVCNDGRRPPANEVATVELEHGPRLFRRSVEMIEERAEAMEQHKLAPEPERAPAKPLKSLLRNSWVLLIMAGIVGIIIAGKARIHVPEPLSRVHATNGVVPLTLPLQDTSVDYLFVNLLIAPYYPPAEPGSAGHRRRLLAAAESRLVGEALSVRSSASGSGGLDRAQQAPMPQLVAAKAEEELERRVRKLLARPKFALPQRQPARRQHRRLLTEGPAEEPANASEVADLPQLQVTIMQRNASALPPGAAGNATAAALAAAAGPLLYFPVSEPQFCTTKDGAAVKCSMVFQSGDLTAALVPGEPLYLGFEATQVTQLVFQAEVSDLGWLGPAKNWIALGILAAVLVGIASERIHRMWCAMIGAGLMMGLLLWMNMAPSLALVVDWLDESTLGLLWGMMIIVGRLKDTGMFELMSAAAVRLSRGKMWALSLMLMVGTGFLSAFLDNVTTMLLIAPVSISVMRQCNQDPIPLLISMTLMSNIGGAATMVGDPPALIIGTALSRYIGFVDFIINMGPGVLMAAAACIPLVLFLYRRTMMPPIQRYAAMLEEVKSFRITNWDLFAKSAYVTLVVLVGFLLHPVHHVDPAWFAVLGAIVLCVCDAPMEVERVVHTVEWDMLLFFASMFVMIEASAEVGMISMIAGWLETAIKAAPEGSRLIIAIQILLWVSAVISGVLDNIPYTIVMVPVIEYLAFAGLGLELPTLAWALNFGACFGGNATLIGASANIVTATLAERAGHHITFFKWLKAGVPITIVSVAMADVWMILRFCL